MVAGGILIAVLFPDRKSCGEPNPGFAERKDDRKVDGEMFDFVFPISMFMRLNGV